MYLRMLLIVAVVLLGGACDPESGGGGGTGGTSTTFTCPSKFPSTTEVTIPGANVSSIKVLGGSTAELSGSAWCGTPPPSITEVDVGILEAEYGCPGGGSCGYNVLLAVDVGPDGTSFSLTNTPLRPELRYDLDAVGNPCRESCDLAVYQVVNGGWLPVGSAEYESFGGADVAIAKLSHFSIFALVELPDPQPIPPTTTEGIVASAFIHEPPEDGGEPIRVSFLFEAGLPELGIEGPSEPLIRLWNVDPSNLPDQCGRGTTGDSLSCIFPIGTPVRLDIQETSIVIESLDSGVAVELFSSLIEIF